MRTWKLAPAITTDKALIVKTPELTPPIQQLPFLKADFPPDMIGILCHKGKSCRPRNSYSSFLCKCLLGLNVAALVSFPL